MPGSNQDGQTFYEDASIAITVSATPDEVRVSMRGEIDSTSADALANLVRRGYELAGDGPRALVVDLSGVSYCGSAGVRFVVQMSERAARRGIELRIIGANPMVRRVFEAVELVDLLDAS